MAMCQEFKELVSVTGVNVGKEGEEGLEHALKWLHVGLVGLQMMATTFSVKKAKESTIRLAAERAGLNSGLSVSHLLLDSLEASFLPTLCSPITGAINSRN